ncbi:IS110 family transposase [Marinobacterium rhizophilum]|uniref:IS110 family transposase n=1 Tax=Marinobacterium rhizophilum TaxID=420402 RepID=A0ABY5HIX5_9GAMM|nr:IS110 family transposase [Marinobacterium rhizophilum]UTW12331.1 IS110 family transposase [Marinobacterium rhizophilum]
MNKLTTIGIDLAKNSFALVALSTTGKALWRKTLTRSRMLRFLAQQEPSHIAMEACAGAHYWGREIQQLGHRVSLLPPQHVKGYQRGQKNDYNDAAGIAEACQHGQIRPVRVKTLEEQDAQLFGQLRLQLSQEHTRLINQVRALLAEYGIAIRQGVTALYAAVPELLDDDANALTPRLRLLLNRQYQRLQALRTELAWYEQEVKRQAREDDVCCRLMEVPGIGPIVSGTLKHWMGDGQQFKRGRDASAALGLVPRQHSTGGHQLLLGISKCGNRAVRSQVVHGARAVVAQAGHKVDPLSQWINRLVATRGYNKAMVALANKLVRIAWIIVARGEHYQPKAAA